MKKSIKERFKTLIGPDGCDANYQGSDSDWMREKDLISTEYGLMSVKQYEVLIKKKLIKINEKRDSWPVLRYDDK